MAKLAAWTGVFRGSRLRDIIIKCQAPSIFPFLPYFYSSKGISLAPPPNVLNTLSLLKWGTVFMAENEGVLAYNRLAACFHSLKEKDERWNVD